MGRKAPSEASCGRTGREPQIRGIDPLGDRIRDVDVMAPTATAHANLIAAVGLPAKPGRAALHEPGVVKWAQAFSIRVAKDGAP